MTAAELAEQLTVIAGQTKALRDSGVIGRVNVGDVSFEIGEALAPAEPNQEAAPSNPLDDPDTFGGHIPQRRVRSEKTTPASTEDDDD